MMSNELFAIDKVQFDDYCFHLLSTIQAYSWVEAPLIRNSSVPTLEWSCSLTQIPSCSCNPLSSLAYCGWCRLGSPLSLNSRYDQDVQLVLESAWGIWFRNMLTHLAFLGSWKRKKMRNGRLLHVFYLQGS